MKTLGQVEGNVTFVSGIAWLPDGTSLPIPASVVGQNVGERQYARLPEVTGEYSDDGYRIFVDGEEMYEAGNHPMESTSWISDGLSLDTMRKYCIQTGKEVAQERGGVFTGAVCVVACPYCEEELLNPPVEGECPTCGGTISFP
jgi:hypothetical protein